MTASGKPTLSQRRAAAGQQYAIMIGLIAVVALLAINQVGSSVRNLMTNTGNVLSNVAGGGSGGVSVGGGGSGGGSPPPPPALTPTSWNVRCTYSGYAAGTVSITNAGKTITHTNTADVCYTSAYSTSSGKYYVEYTLVNAGDLFIGFTDVAGTPNTAYITGNRGYCTYSGGATGSIGDLPNGTIVRVAIDFDTDKVWFAVGGSWVCGGGDPNLGGAGLTIANGTYYATFAGNNDATGKQVIANFGQTAFTYAVPSGFQPGFGAP